MEHKNKDLETFYCICCNKTYYTRIYNRHRKTKTHQKRELKYLNRTGIRKIREKKEPKSILNI